MSKQNASQNRSTVKQVYKNASGVNGEKKKTSPRITLCLSEEELVKLKNLSHGISLSAYIRKCLFGKDVTPRKLRSRIFIIDIAIFQQQIQSGCCTQPPSTLHDILFILKM